MRLTALIVLLLLNNGCTVIGVGTASVVGGTYYITGEIRSSYPIAIEHLEHVVLYTFQDEGITTESVTKTQEGSDIQGTLSSGESIKVHIYYNDEKESSVGIRIGTFGDEKRSRQLLKKMEEYM